MGESWICFWNNFFPRKRPQTKLVASWQPEKDQLVPCRLRGLKIKRQKNEQYWETTLKRNIWEGRKRIRRILIGMVWKRRIWNEKGFWTPFMCFREKDMLRIHILSENSWLLTHSFGQEIIFVFPPFMQKKTDCLRHCSMKTLKQINLLYNRDKKDWATISLFKLDNS